MEHEVKREDIEQLKLLSIFHYVAAVLTILFGCFPIFHLVFGVFMLFEGFDAGVKKANPNDEMTAKMFGGIIVVFAGLMILVAWSMAIVLFFSARNLSRHQNYKFCFVTACVICIQMPIGTVLGIFTILVLNRPSVKLLFWRNLPSQNEKTFRHR